MEWHDFGWNVMSVSFIGTMVFAVFRAWASWSQAMTIWRMKSGQSVPVTYYTYQLATFIVVVGYGLTIGSWALVISASLTVLFTLPILLGLWIYRGFTRLETVAAVAFLLVDLLLAVPEARAGLFMAFAIGSVAVMSIQPLVIWRNRDAGAVNVRPSLVGVANALFWTVYSFAIGDPLLEIINPCFLVTFLATVILWFIYRRRPDRPQA